MNLNIKIDDKLRGGKYQQPIDRLSRDLEKIVEEIFDGDPPKIDEARWELVAGSDGRDTLALYLKDWAGEARVEFQAARLDDEYHVRTGLLRILSDLMRQRSRVRNREMRAVFAEGAAV